MHTFHADRLVIQSNRPRASWFKIVAVVMIVIFFNLAIETTGWAQDSGAGPDERTQSTASQYGLGSASVFLSIPYGLGKFLFATLGGIFGGFTYAFSGGNEAAAKSVWNTSMRGTYVITPEHLQGNKAVRFLGVPPEEEAASQQPPGEPALTAPEAPK